jgi:hypothetical protein
MQVRQRPVHGRLVQILHPAKVRRVKDFLRGDRTNPAPDRWRKRNGHAPLTGKRSSGSEWGGVWREPTARGPPPTARRRAPTRVDRLPRRRLSLTQSQYLASNHKMYFITYSHMQCYKLLPLLFHNMNLANIFLCSSFSL